MKTKFKVTLVVFLVIILGCFSQVFAAIDNDVEIGTNNLNNTVNNSANWGDILKYPEIGWKRFDDSNSYLLYSGDTSLFNDNRAYNNSYTIVKNGGKCKFRFYGSKIRLICTYYYDKDNNAAISIDGIKYNFNCKGTTDPKVCSLVYNKDLSNAIHEVEITSSTVIEIDAIDIDSTGYLINPSAELATGISLNKTTDLLIFNDPIKGKDTLTAKVTPDNVTNKTVTWKSSDSSIVTVDENGNIKGVRAGTVVITATADGKTASCTVTVKDKEIVKSKLTLYMNDKTIRELYLTQNELDDFINWYNLKSEGEVTVKPYYVFNVSVPGKSSTRKSYVWFMKIESFEVE